MGQKNYLIFFGKNENLSLPPRHVPIHTNSLISSTRSIVNYFPPIYLLLFFYLSKCILKLEHKMLGEDVSATQVSVLEMNKKNSCPLKGCRQLHCCSRSDICKRKSDIQQCHLRCNNFNQTTFQLGKMKEAIKLDP